MKKALSTILFITILMCFQYAKSQNIDNPLQVGIARMTHDHVHGILNRPDKGDIEIVGIVEPNRELAQRYADRYGFSMELVYNTLPEMIKATNPEAVAAFGSIYEHLNVVEVCAPLGIHVMVEKPLAVSVEHARKMQQLAEKHHIELLTNFETTWYATNHKTYEMVHENAIGDLRKVVIHDGHKGPKEIGISDEFLEWLTDPVKNGGGAVIDFGCYGANLVTWLKDGERPEAVMAITQTIKPDIYSNVDDEATILLQYPKMQAVIQASWNWPFGRKDMEVYGQTGYIYCDDGNTMRYRLNEDRPEETNELDGRPAPFDDPFSLFHAVISKDITLSPYDLSSLENNMIVVEILEAAKESAASGKKVYLDK